MYNVVDVVNGFLMQFEASLKAGLYRCYRTRRELRLTQDSCKGLDQGSILLNPTMELSPPTMYSIFNR
jgi:hypothetical protein